MQINKHTFYLLINVLILGALSGCKPVESGSSDSSGAGLCSGVAQQAEIPLCTDSVAYSGNSKITGTATFSKRGLAVTSGGSGTPVTRLILSTPISPMAIRFAEVRVLNSAGQVVQCGRTNTSGQLKALDGSSDLIIPDTADAYQVEVLSRTDHTLSGYPGKAAFNALFSVKEDFCSEKVHRISTTVNSSGTGTFPASLNATALEGVSSKVEGGAFNIYNDVITAFDYLSQNTGTQDLTCLNPKFSVFWKAGFNPNQYIYPSADPGSLGTISFYLRSDRELYINGGILGNVSSVDTDHFDDSVIIHELGHHIENVCATMDSPGGSHNGNLRIDPRLAWSEGWGNYFSAHIIKNNLNKINPNLSSTLPDSQWLYYFDSEGHTTNGYEYIRFNLARPGNSTTESLYIGPGQSGPYAFDPVNPASYPGESHFREVSISRALFKITNTCLAPFANCADQDNFSDLWKAFDKKASGMGQSIYPFRSSARLLERLEDVMGGSFSGLNSILTGDEALQKFGDSAFISGGALTWPAYGTKLIPNGSTPCTFRIQPRENDIIYDTSDQRYSNHYFHIDKNVLPGVTSIRLQDVTNLGGTVNIPIDLLVFNDSYFYNEDCDGSSCTRGVDSEVITSTRTSEFGANAYPKYVNIQGLSGSSNYLLNVRAYTPGSVSTSTVYSYTLRDQSGGYLCPNSSY